jgi:hypothetical protein
MVWLRGATPHRARSAPPCGSRHQPRPTAAGHPCRSTSCCATRRCPRVRRSRAWPSWQSHWARACHRRLQWKLAAGWPDQCRGALLVHVGPLPDLYHGAGEYHARSDPGRDHLWRMRSHRRGRSARLPAHQSWPAAVAAGRLRHEGGHARTEGCANPDTIPDPGERDSVSSRSVRLSSADKIHTVSAVTTAWRDYMDLLAEVAPRTRAEIRPAAGTPDRLRSERARPPAELDEWFGLHDGAGYELHGQVLPINFLLSMDGAFALSPHRPGCHRASQCGRVRLWSARPQWRAASSPGVLGPWAGGRTA